MQALAQLIACEVHPLNNLRVLGYLRGELKLDEAAVSQVVFALGRRSVRPARATRRPLERRALLLRRLADDRRRLPPAADVQRAALLLRSRAVSDARTAASRPASTRRSSPRFSARRRHGTSSSACGRLRRPGGVDRAAARLVLACARRGFGDLRELRRRPQLTSRIRQAPRRRGRRLASRTRRPASGRCCRRSSASAASRRAKRGETASGCRTCSCRRRSC